MTTAEEEEALGSSNSAWLWIFPLVIALPTELSFQIGTLRLTPYRVALLACFFPSAYRALLSPHIQRRLPDLLTTLFGLWAVLALATRNSPLEALESGGILLAESLGAYLLARSAVCSVGDLRRFLRSMTVLMLVLFAAGLPETLSGRHLTHDFFGLLGNRTPTDVEGRFGMARAYVSFDHPILLGTFAGMWLALLWDARRGDGFVRRAARGVLVMGATACSLSSACLMAIFLQAALIAYRQVTRWLPVRWLLLISAIIAGYGLISAASSRSGIKVLLWYLTFDRDTASYRISIWEHALDDVARAPLFGVGIENWERPSWMTPSIDSFWLVLSMNYGLVAVGALALAVLIQILRVAFAPKGDADLLSLRLSWCFSMIALCMVGFTVHFWNNVFCAFFFMLGCGGALSKTRTRLRFERP